MRDTVYTISKDDNKGIGVRSMNDCDYCNGEPFNIIENTPFNTERIELSIKDATLMANVYNRLELRAYGQKKISYCPMCGRKL